MVLGSLLVLDGESFSPVLSAGSVADAAEVFVLVAAKSDKVYRPLCRSRLRQASFTLTSTRPQHCKQVRRRPASSLQRRLSRPLSGSAILRKAASLGSKGTAAPRKIKARLSASQGRAATGRERATAATPCWVSRGAAGAPSTT